MSASSAVATKVEVLERDEVVETVMRMWNRDFPGADSFTRSSARADLIKQLGLLRDAGFSVVRTPGWKRGRQR